MVYFMENPIKMDDLGGFTPYFWVNSHVPVDPIDTPFNICGFPNWHLPGTFQGDGSLGPLLDPRLSRLQFGHRVIKEPELDLKVRCLVIGWVVPLRMPVANEGLGRLGFPSRFPNLPKRNP